MSQELDNLSDSEIEQILGDDAFAFCKNAERIPRPYSHRDFDKSGTSFIPDLIIALLMALNFAVAPAKINTTEPKAKQVASATNQQSHANYINYLTALQKVRGC